MYVYGYNENLGHWYIQNTVSKIRTYLYKHCGEHDARQMCAYLNRK